LAKGIEGMTILLRTIYTICILSCCVIAIALTEVKGHVNIGKITISYNETAAEYKEIVMSSALSEQLLGGK
jgi:hypothetical protein